MAAAKPKNYREMADDELAKEVDALTKALFNLRVRKVTDVVENPAAFRQHRREIARIRTEQRARELKIQAAAPAKAPVVVPAPAKAKVKTKTKTKAKAPAAPSKK